MLLNQDDAAKIVLIRSIEECERKLFSDSLLVQALAAAQGEAPGLSWVKARAEFLGAHLSTTYRSIAHLAQLPSPWTVFVCLSALVLGFFTNWLGPSDKIHLVRNPVLLLVAWNLVIYLILGVLWLAHLRRPSRVHHEPTAGVSDEVSAVIKPRRAARANVPWLIKFMTPTVWNLFHRFVIGLHEKVNLAEISSRFSINWFAVAPELVMARWKTLLHLGALSLAIGAVMGMYFQGLFQGFHVIWTSTFVTAKPAVALFVQFLFGPSLGLSSLLDLGLAERIDAARLLSPEGDRAAPWIHLFAITVFIAIVVPRAALALWQWRWVRRFQERIGLALDPYYGEVIEAPVRALIEQEVRSGTQSVTEDIAGYVAVQLYDEQITPRLRRFREQGGKIAELKAEIQTMSEQFLPQLDGYIATTRFPEFQKSLSQRIGEMLKNIGTEFRIFHEPQAVLAGMVIPSPNHAEGGISEQFARTVSLSIGTSIALAIAAVSGGIGKHLGVAIVSTLLGTTGPVGFVIGLMIGAVVAAGAWWVGKEAITETIEGLHLPGAVVKAALWESRFQKLLDQGRQKCADAVRVSVDEKLKPLNPLITAEILARVRTLWQI